MLRDLLLTPLRPVMRGVLEPSGTRTLAQAETELQADDGTTPLHADDGTTTLTED